MMYPNIGDRFKSYEKTADYSLVSRLPIVIRVNGRSFNRVTQKLSKPFCSNLSDVMAKTMMYSIMEIQGAIFGYQHHDEINFIIKNDQSLEVDPWYQNRIQKIISITASLITRSFYRNLNQIKPELELVGDALFDARTFVLPNIGEVVNYLIWRQQDCYRQAVSSATQELLINKLGKKPAARILYKASIDEKKELFLEHSGLKFEEFYPNPFYKGTSAYKIPIIMPATRVNVKNKWILSNNVPFFPEEKDFIYNLLLNGKDVFRADNVLPLATDS